MSLIVEIGVIILAGQSSDFGVGDHSTVKGQELILIAELVVGYVSRNVLEFLVDEAYKAFDSSVASSELQGTLEFRAK